MIKFSKEYSRNRTKDIVFLTLEGSEKDVNRLLSLITNKLKGNGWSPKS